MRVSHLPAHLAATLLICLALTIARPAVAQDDAPTADWSAAFEPATAAPGSAVKLVITTELPAGWHTYAVTQDDTGTTVRLKHDTALSPIDGWMTTNVATDLEGHKICTGKVRYERKFLVSNDATVGTSLTASAEITWMVCNELACMPPATSTIGAHLMIAATPGAAPASLEDRLAAAELRNAELAKMVEKLTAALTETNDRLKSLERSLGQETAPLELPEGVDAAALEKAIESLMVKIQKKHERAQRMQRMEDSMTQIEERTPRLVEFLAQRMMLDEKETAVVTNGLIDFQKGVAKIGFASWDEDWSDDKVQIETGKLTETLKKKLIDAGIEEETVDQIIASASRMGGAGRGGFGGGGFGGQGGRGGRGGQGGGGGFGGGGNGFGRR